MPPAPDRRIRVALADDYEVVVRGLEGMLVPFADRIRVVELDVNALPHEPVDITLYDTFARPQVTDTTIDTLLNHKPSGSVVVFTWNVDPALAAVAKAKGLRGYLSKAMDGEKLVAALEQVYAGEVVFKTDQLPLGSAWPGQPDWPARSEGLTARESEVVSLITQGFSNQEIADRTYLSINSVKTYIRSAYRRMGVSSRSQAVIWGVHHGLLPDRGQRSRHGEAP
ncbi:MAG: response regulator transcription factor [Ornithinimicrobium sp.]